MSGARRLTLTRTAPQRLARELSVWKRLEHKHVLKLLGTVAGFGPYASMVCPWLEQGSVSKYMERRGDILSMTDRLQLVSGRWAVRRVGADVE